jgi:hypothetical protein
VSTAAKQVIGLLPDSAAARAGLREGQELAGWAFQEGDIDHDVVIQIQDGDITYVPRRAQSW